VLYLSSMFVKAATTIKKTSLPSLTRHHRSMSDAVHTLIHARLGNEPLTSRTLQLYTEFFKVRQERKKRIAPIHKNKTKEKS
jgi:Mg2+/Co2+ transporter CorC